MDVRTYVHGINAHEHQNVRTYVAGTERVNTNMFEDLNKILDFTIKESKSYITFPIMGKKNPFDGFFFLLC